VLNAAKKKKKKKKPDPLPDPLLTQEERVLKAEADRLASMEAALVNKDEVAAKVRDTNQVAHVGDLF
jgi:hypothetical protein